MNGKSITLATMDDCEVIDYFHIELETHQVVFAEGAPAETLLITGIARASKFRRIRAIIWW